MNSAKFWLLALLPLPLLATTASGGTSFNPHPMFTSVNSSPKVAENFPVAISEPMKRLRETKKCSSCNLAGANFHYADLTGADLSGANLTGADFEDAKLAGANLTNATVQGANFIKAEGLNSAIASSLAERGASVEFNSGNKSEVRARSAQLKIKLLDSQLFYSEPHDRTLQVIRGNQAMPAVIFRLGRYPHTRRLQIKDLDGDGEPEIMADFHSGGAHCCKFSWIFRYDPKQGRYTGIEHTWGDIDYKLGQSGQVGVPAFYAYDTRFGYRFGSFASSRFPVQIWQYRQGKLIDVTRQHPQQISEQAEYIWQEIRAFKGDKKYAMPGVAAYMAAQYLLGQETKGWQQIRNVFPGNELQFYLNDVLSFLQATSYAPNPDLQRRLVRSLDQHSGLAASISAVAISPDGQLLATASQEGVIQIWQVNTGKLLKTLPKQSERIEGLAISHNHQFLAIQGSAVKVWNLQTGTIVRVYGATALPSGNSQGMTFTPEGQLLTASQDIDKSDDVVVWNLTIGKHSSFKTDQFMFAFRFSPDGRFLVGSGNKDNYSFDSSSEIGRKANTPIRLWNLETDQLVQTLPEQFNRMEAISISPDGKTLTTLPGENTIQVWNLQTGKGIQTITGLGNIFGDRIAISADGKLLANSNYYDNTVKILRLAP